MRSWARGRSSSKTKSSTVRARTSSTVVPSSAARRARGLREPPSPRPLSPTVAPVPRHRLCNRPGPPGSLSFVLGHGGKTMRESSEPADGWAARPELDSALHLIVASGAPPWPSTVPRPTPLVDTRAVLNDRIAHLVGAGVVEIVRLVTVVVPDTAFRDGPDARSGDVADNCSEL